MPMQRYGRSWPIENWNVPDPNVVIELAAFREGLTPEQGGLGKYRHCKNLLKVICPWFKQHPWSDTRFKSLCSNPVNVWTGNAASGKTTDAAVFGFLFWLAKPKGTSVILSSTTGKMVRKRAWPIIQECYNGFKNCPGNLVDSKTTLQTSRGDDKNGIFGIAVADGPIDKAIANIKGVHNERMCVIIDEGTDTPEAVFGVLTNLQKGCKEFHLIVIGNATSKLDPHGRLSEPKSGWNSITVEDEEWDIKGVSQWGIESGVALHFDGEKSPNVKAGEDKWPFIFTIKDLNKARSFPDAQETVGYWRDTRGFWPPDGICRTIFSENLIEKHDGKGKHIFRSQKITIAACDFGFGGDKCVLRFAELGDIEDGRQGIQLTESVHIPIKATSKEPIHYQIASRVIHECKQRGVTPEHFAGDSTGEGGGTMDIISQEWYKPENRTANVVRVEFGGSASDLPVSQDDHRPAKDAYDRKVTELYYSTRNFLMAGQLKGLNIDECIQFCSREYELRGKKVVLDKKSDTKAKIGRSPDDADCCVLIIELARRLGAVSGSANRGSRTVSWRQSITKFNQVYANADYSGE